LPPAEAFPQERVLILQSGCDIYYQFTMSRPVKHDPRHTAPRARDRGVQQARVRARTRKVASPVHLSPRSAPALIPFQNSTTSVPPPLFPSICAYVSPIRLFVIERMTRLCGDSSRCAAALNGLSPLNLDETRLHEHPNVSHVYV